MDWFSHFVDSIKEDDFKNWVETKGSNEIESILRKRFASEKVISRSIPQDKGLTDFLPSSLLGKLGESKVMDALRPYVTEDTSESKVMDALRPYVTEDTAYSPHAGDVAVTYKGKHFLVEVKNYSKTVPTRECDKFIRDVSTNYCLGGIIVALDTGIAKKKKLELEYHDKPCLFVSSPPSEEYILCCLELMYKVCSADVEGDIDKHLEVMNNVCYQMGLIRDKVSMMQKDMSDVIINLWKQQENILRSISTFTAEVPHKVTDVDYYTHSDDMRIMINTLLGLKDDVMITRTGNKYKGIMEVEILKTKVYVYTDKDITPQKNYVYRGGQWKIPLDKITFPILSGLS